MKNTLIFVGLTALSILYLFEVDFAHLSYWNLIAFVIIALTLIPLFWRMVTGIYKKIKAHRIKKLEKEQSQEEE